MPKTNGEVMSLPRTIEMTIDDWIVVPDNPRQRDTERHAKKARKKHLKNDAITQTVVFAATINGEIRWKLDGHTRSYLWKIGELERPSHNKVLVLLIPVDGTELVKEYYTHFDTQTAAEDSKDRVTGACNEQGLMLVSKAFNAGGFATALRLADGDLGHRKKDEYTLIENWKDMLVIVDSWDLKRTIPPILGLALLSTASASDESELERVQHFFVNYQEDKGIKSSRHGRDGVQALTEYIDRKRSSKAMNGYENYNEMIYVAAICLENYIKDKYIKTNYSLRHRKVSGEKILSSRRAIAKMRLAIPVESCIENNLEDEHEENPDDVLSPTCSKILQMLNPGPMTRTDMNKKLSLRHRRDLGDALKKLESWNIIRQSEVKNSKPGQNAVSWEFKTYNIEEK